MCAKISAKNIDSSWRWKTNTHIQPVAMFTTLERMPETTKTVFFLIVLEKYWKNLTTISHYTDNIKSIASLIEKKAFKNKTTAMNIETINPKKIEVLENSFFKLSFESFEVPIFNTPAHISIHTTGTINSV